MSEGFEQTADFALLPQDWWFGGQYVLEFGLEIFISMYTRELP